MKPPPARPALALSALALLFLTLGAGGVTTGVVAVLRVELLSDDEELSFGAIARRNSHLDQQGFDRRERIRARDETVQAVIAGELPLEEAATRFGELNPQGYDSTLQALYPECTTEHERLCRQVILQVGAFLQGDPRHDEVVMRLRAGVKRAS